VRRRAGLTVLLDPFLAAAGSSRRAARGQAGAPAAAQRRGRTSLRPASVGRSSRAGRVRLGWLTWGRVLFPGAWLAEWSRKHPSGAAPACGRLPWPCVRDRAAQSEDRARRWRRLMPQGRACPGL